MNGKIIIILLFGIFSGVIMGVAGNQHLDRVLGITDTSDSANSAEQDMLVVAAKQLSVTLGEQNIGSVKTVDYTDTGEVRLSIEVDASKLDGNQNLDGKSVAVRAMPSPSLDIIETDNSNRLQLLATQSNYVVQLSQVDLLPVIATAAGGQNDINAIEDLNAVERLTLRTANQTRSAFKSLKNDFKQGFDAMGRVMNPSEWDKNY